MIVAIAADHGGFELKAKIVAHLKEMAHEVHDLGTDSAAPVDYPDFAKALAAEIREKKADRGILICGSGVGACIAVNKFPVIRAGLCHDSFSAHQGVEDDDVNVLCLGARIIGVELAKELVRIWLAAVFSGAERHCRRVSKVEAIEKEFMR